MNEFELATSLLFPISIGILYLALFWFLLRSLSRVVKSLAEISSAQRSMAEAILRIADQSGARGAR